MKLWQKIAIRLLYLTPIGYLFSVVFLFQGKRTPGINILFKRYSPIGANIKKSPTSKERIVWFINAIFLLAEAWFVFVNEIGGAIGGTFGLLALVFGVVSLVSAVFPCFPWNKKIF